MADIEVTVSPATATTVEVSSPVAAPSMLYTGVQGPPGADGTNGNSFDQSLNTTDSPTFAYVQINDGNDGYGMLAQYGVSGRSDNGHVGNWSLSKNAVVFNQGDDGGASTAIEHGLISYTSDSITIAPSVYSFPPASGTLALTSDIPTVGTAARLDVAATGDASSIQVVKGDDSRLSNARTPLDHNQIIQTITVPSYSATTAAYPVWVPSQNARGGNWFFDDRSQVVRLVSGLIPASQLPSYVDDVLEYATTSNFPATGETGKIYVATGSGKIYRWSGSVYVEISPSTAQVQSDWNASSGLGVILNKPTLFSGSYTDLTNTPSLPDQSLNSTDGVVFQSVYLNGYALFSPTNVNSQPIQKGVTFFNSSDNKYYGYTSDISSGLKKFTMGDASDLTSGTLDAARLPSTAVTTTGTQTLTNKSISSSQITGLASVATSGSYADLTGKPTLFSGSYTDLTSKPTLFSGSYTDLTSKPTLGTAASKDIPATGNASATQVVYGSDTRLTDSRTPSAHASSHASGGSDALTLAASQITGLASVATSGAYSALSGTPSLATVATSGSYTDLSNLPVIAKKSTADITSTNTTLADVTGLTGFTLDANTMYRFEFAGRHTCVSGGSQYLVLNSTQAIANASAQGWYVIFGSRTDAGFSNPSGNLYAFINRSSTGNTNNPSAAVYYIMTGSSAPTMKIQFSQTGTATGTATLLSGAVAVFTKLI
jgi:hypothetical protein